MEIVQALENYTLAQKTVATNFIYLGIGLIIFLIATWIFAPSGQLSNGLKYGSLVCGILIIIGGFSYNNFSQRILDNGIKAENENHVQFVQNETIRMEKVEKVYPIYQMVFGALIAIPLLLILFVNRPLLNGISFSVMILFLFLMIIEAYSHKSILEYAKYLKDLM
jgi:hypothetical protein